MTSAPLQRDRLPSWRASSPRARTMPAKCRRGLEILGVRALLRFAQRLTSRPIRPLGGRGFSTLRRPQRAQASGPLIRSRLSEEMQLVLACISLSLSLFARAEVAGCRLARLVPACGSVGGSQARRYHRWNCRFVESSGVAQHMSTIECHREPWPPWPSLFVVPSSIADAQDPRLNASLNQRRIWTAEQGLACLGLVGHWHPLSSLRAVAISRIGFLLILAGALGRVECAFLRIGLRSSSGQEGELAACRSPRARPCALCAS